MISDEGQDWDGKRGYVPEHFGAAALREAPFDMYLCGPPPMVESVKSWLADNAIDNGHLYFEKFTESNT
ncbi:Anthranilate 1,2-dioxygenase electron transfer component [compost metagenome]